MKYSSLIEALMMGDYGGAKELLESGADPNWTEDGAPVLCEWLRGMESPNRELLDLLLEYGLDPNLKIKVYDSPYDIYFKTPINCIAEEMTRARGMRDEEYMAELEAYLNMLLDIGADPALPRLSPLYHPAIYGYIDVIEKLVEMGVSPDAPAGMSGNIAPIISASRNLKVARALEFFGASPTARDVFGQNPLFALVSTFDRSVTLFNWVRAPISLVRHLIKAGNDPLESGNKEATLLHSSAYGGNAKAAALFLKKGVPVDARDVDGDTALHYAAYQRWLHTLDGGLDVIDVLVENGVPIDELNGEGLSPLHIAIINRRSEIALRLLDMGADSTLRTSGGMTPLDLLVEAYGDEAKSTPLWSRLSGIGVTVPVLERDEDYPLPERVSRVVSLLGELDKWSSVLEGMKWKEVFLLYPAVGYSAEGRLMRLGGGVPGLGRDRWPLAREEVFRNLYEEFEGTRRGFRRWWKEQREKYPHVPDGFLPMEHFLTVDLRLFSELPAGVPDDAVALSIFLPVLSYGLGEYLAQGKLNPRDFYGMVYLTEEDIERGIEEEAPRYTEFQPVPVLHRRVLVPEVVFYIPDPSLVSGSGFEEPDLRELFSYSGKIRFDVENFAKRLMELNPDDRSALLDTLYRLKTLIERNSYMGGIPIYLQESEGEKGFIMQVSDDITEFEEVVFVNFSMGIWYVFADRMFGQTG